MSKKSKLSIVIFIVTITVLLVGNKIIYSRSLEPNTFDISTEVYRNKISEIFYDITKKNGKYNFAGYTCRYPYIQIYIKPTDLYSDEELNESAINIITELIIELKKYKFESKKIGYSYEYLNIYFYHFDSEGKVVRNNDIFMQINILDIENLKTDDVIWQ